MTESVERFDPVERMIKIGKADYLLVRDRLLWARQEHPNLCITTELLRFDETIAVFKACADYVDDDGAIVRAEGHGSETPKGFPDYLEKAETVAIGRALGALGYGTQAAFEETGDGKIADAPVTRNQPTRNQWTRPATPQPLPGTEQVASRRTDQRTGAIEDDAPVMANDGQVQAIERFWKELGRDEEGLSKYLNEQYAQEDARALTQEQAGQEIVKLGKERNVERAMAMA
jgi:hypothetical protein